MGRERRCKQVRRTLRAAVIAGILSHAEAYFRYRDWKAKTKR